MGTIVIRMLGRLGPSHVAFLRRLYSTLAESALRLSQSLVLDVQSDEGVRKVLERALGAGARVESLIPKRESLEDIFVRKAL